MNMIAAAVALTSFFTLQAPALAEHDSRAQLRLTIVDEANVPVPNAVVTVFTMYGPRTINADRTGVVVVADLPAETTQVWARTPGRLEGAEATKLTPGENKYTLTLHPARPHTATES
jgi:hypothetical protein